MAGSRTCCLDLDTFFVSVERLLDPSLVGKPVIVGARKGQRGVVTAASYEVRALGVHSGMPRAEAERLAPRAIFLPTRHGTYTPYARRVRAVLETFTPEVQTASIDEFFLDFSGCERLYRRPGDPDDDATVERVVRAMRQRVRDEVGLPASAGVAPTRALAKMASGRAKPAGVLMIRPGQERAFASPLPVRKYPGIGPVAEARLQAHGIHTLGQLLDVRTGPFAELGGLVRRGVDGSGPRGVVRDRPAFQEHDDPGSTVGSISNERTFLADVGHRQQVEAQLLALCERVCWRARQRRVKARTVTLRLRYADFDTLTRGCTVAPTHDDLTVFRCIQDLLVRAWTRDLALRLVGVALSSLVPEDRQLALPFQRREQGTAVDAVRARFGYDAIHLGRAGDRTGWNA